MQLRACIRHHESCRRSERTVCHRGGWARPEILTSCRVGRKRREGHVSVWSRSWQIASSASRALRRRGRRAQRSAASPRCVWSSQTRSRRLPSHAEPKQLQHAQASERAGRCAICRQPQDERRQAQWKRRPREHRYRLYDVRASGRARHQSSRQLPSMMPRPPMRMRPYLRAAKRRHESRLRDRQAARSRRLSS